MGLSEGSGPAVEEEEWEGIRSAGGLVYEVHHHPVRPRTVMSHPFTTAFSVAFGFVVVAITATVATADAVAKHPRLRRLPVEPVPPIPRQFLHRLLVRAQVPPTASRWRVWRVGRLRQPVL